MIAIDTKTNATGATPAKTLTLELTPFQTEAMCFAQNMGGIEFTLRSIVPEVDKDDILEGDLEGGLLDRGPESQREAAKQRQSRSWVGRGTGASSVAESRATAGPSREICCSAGRATRAMAGARSRGRRLLLPSLLSARRRAERRLLTTYCLRPRANRSALSAYLG